MRRVIMIQAGARLRRLQPFSIGAIAFAATILTIMGRHGVLFACA